MNRSSSEPDAVSIGDCIGQERAAQPEMPPGGWLNEHRAELLDRHPMTLRRYTIPTPMIQNAYRLIRERVYARRTGLIFIGRTRYGKTTCAREVRQYLQEEFPRIHVIAVAARSTLRPIAGHVYRVILESERHVCAARADANLLLRNVLSDIETCLHTKNGDQFVMILDEVNLFDQHDLINLLELGNALDMRGITMTVISFGQPDIEERITSFREQNKAQITARFFRQPRSFDGCTGPAMLREILRFLDESSEWPEGSHWSYTEFFFPEAFRNGFRIHQNADLIWHEMFAAGPGTENQLSMEDIAMTVEWLFLSLHRHDCEGFSLAASDVQAALQASDMGWGR
ncbi:ATP-binding protein [Burkholderia diffusa]|uniref:ATP-binding protein n=1 Tax=Burkholderia diffusa TaxID=488732 RepID=UPI00157A6FD0|nr:ATP-binding protein [Burkholderia diffusa]NTY39851.1 ATP-binding protein [Burkholderia diffusa]